MAIKQIFISMQNTLKLILQDKEFIIPSDIRYFNDIRAEVRNSLLSTKQYIVKSNVHEAIFESFIKFWANKEIPNFTSDNISEYDQLSEEFSLMEEVISVYKNLSQQLQAQESKNQQLSLQINEKTTKHRQIAQILSSSDLLIQSPLRSRIYEALQTENVELIRFYSNPCFESNGLVYIINKDDQTAVVIKFSESLPRIVIPSTVTPFFSKYNVTRIYEKAFHNGFLQTVVIPKSVTEIGDEAFVNCHNLKKVSFERNSQLKSIGKFCFCCSGIRELFLPSNFIEFGSEWCSMTNSLTSLNVSPSKQNCICLYKNQFLLSKSDPKSDIFDTLLLASRDIQRVVIPSFIKKIAQCAFDQCVELEEVECSPNSELKIIGEKAFCGSTIGKLTIPSSFDKFEDEWCCDTNNLVDIVVMKQQVENITYYDDSFILGKTDLKSDVFDILYFAQRNVVNVTIPSFVKIIGSSAFDGCESLFEVNFPKDSQLVSIGKSCFAHSSLQTIEIPWQVEKIKKETFNECFQLEVLEIPENSKLKKFGTDSLLGTRIKSLYIPEFVNEFKSNWCDTTEKLINIKISEKNKNFIYYDDKFIIGKSDDSSSVYDVLVFVRRDVYAPLIPSFIKRIASSAFSSCYNLKTVLFQSDSKLETIDCYAFAFTTLKSIRFPSHLKTIEHSTFESCEEMEFLDFEEDSELESLSLASFNNVHIKSFIFPPHLTRLERGYLCFFSPEIIEIQENSELKSLPHSMFSSNANLIMIPVKLIKEFMFY